MFIGGVSRERLDAIADSVGLQLTPGRAQDSLRLRHAYFWPRDERPWQAIASERRIGVCWHGYLAMFAAVYNENPSAYVKTCMATWTDSLNFHNTVFGMKRFNPDAKCLCDSYDIADAERGRLNGYYIRGRVVYEPKHAARQAKRTDRDIARSRAIMAGG